MGQLTVPLVAYWALRGKGPDDGGYRILASSDGAIGADAFDAVIARYPPGTLTDLPQVAVGWLVDRDLDREQRTYLALFVYDRAEDDRGDAFGRPWVRTRCYCVPFEQVAAGALSYRDLQEALSPIPLPTDGNTAPIQIEITARPAESDPDERAMRAAALLLTGKPVCILGADDVSLPERLEFLDRVASFLPYGMRSRLAAATWVGSAFRNHEIRLFFASARRSSDDHVVSWNQDGDEPITDFAARTYFSWLAADPATHARELATVKTEIGFSPSEVGAVLVRFSYLRVAEVAGTFQAGQTGVSASPTPAYAPPDYAVQIASQLRRKSRRPDWVSRAVRDAVDTGLLVFNPPAEMTQGRDERVEVGIARSAQFRHMLITGLRGRGEPQFEEIDTSSFMGVELQGDAFEITALSKPEQVVEPAARWEFDVRPRLAGLHVLRLCICLKIVMPKRAESGDGYRSIPVFEREIKIKVKVSYSVGQFIASNWQWLLVTVIGLGGGISAWITIFH